MKLDRLFAVLALAVSLFAAWEARTVAHRAPSPQPTDPALLLRVERLEATAPDLGETMSGIQVSFAKLWFAADAENWDLAKFEREEVSEGLAAAAAARPDEKGVHLAGIFQAFQNTELVALRESLERRDGAGFRKAYASAVEMCNACHRATGRPFIHITTPTSPPVSNQRWAPEKKATR